MMQVNARINVKEGLLSFKSSFNSRLRTHDIAAARKSLEVRFRVRYNASVTVHVRLKARSRVRANVKCEM